MADVAEAVERLHRQQEALAAFGSFALRQSDLMSVLTEAARVCAEGLAAPFSKVCRYRPVENDLLVEAGYGWQPGVVGKVVSRADETSPQGRAFVTGQPSVCRDLRQGHGFELPPFYAAHGVLSTIDVLIKGSGAPYGVLEIDSVVQRDYDVHDINFLTGFANILAEAVATASRTEILRATIEQMEALIRDKQRLLDQKQALTEELQDFAHIASHDLKAPLRAITQLAAWIEEDLRGATGAETLENLRLMQQRARRLEMRIEGLLAYTRVGMAKAPAEDVDLAELVEEIGRSLSPTPGFTVRFEGQTVVVRTPRPPLEHVLQNLISNAIKHHDRASGHVVISARITGKMTEIRVADDGPGIAPEQHKRIFGIFATLVGQDEHEFAGIGLSIVQKSVTRYGGKVWVDSVPPRRGATFIFTWPTGQGTAEGEKTIPPSEPRS